MAPRFSTLSLLSSSKLIGIDSLNHSTHQTKANLLTTQYYLHPL